MPNKFSHTTHFNVYGCHIIFCIEEYDALVSLSLSISSLFLAHLSFVVVSLSLAKKPP